MNDWQDKLLAALESGKSHATADPDVRAALEAHGRIEEMFAVLQQPASAPPPGLCLSPGTVIGEFSIIRELGTGGMGQVYLARQTRLDRLVAVKVCPPTIAADPRLRSRFEAEGKSLAQLRHPHVVPVLMTGEHQGLLYLVMEYVAGPTLDQVLAALRSASSELSATDVVTATLAGRLLPTATDTSTGGHARLDRSYRTWIIQTLQKVAEGLAAIHQAGMLHRDIKPANIVLDPDGQPKIVDFGLARGATPSTLTVTGEFFGTPAYTSPEQANGAADAITPAADVFSFGAVLYECLTLRRPFDAQTPALVLNAVIHKDPPVLRRVDKQIAWELEAITDKCLRKQPGARYSSAVEVARDVQNYLDLRPLMAKRLSWLGNVKRRVRRQPWAAAFAAALGIALFLSAFLAADARHTYLAARRQTFDELVDRGDGAVRESRLRFGDDLPKWQREIHVQWKKQALDAYTAALQIYPDAVWPLVQRGFLYSTDDATLDLALNDLMRASKLQSRYVSIQTLLARVYEKLGDNEKAQLADSSAEQLYATTTEDLYWMSVIAIQQGEDASRFLSDCLKVDRNHYWARLLFAAEASGIPLHQRIEELRIAAEIRPDLPFASDVLISWKYFRDANPNQSADEMRKVIDQFGLNAYRAQELMKYLEEAGKMDEAITVAMDAYDQAPSHFAFRIGQLKFKQSGFKEAEQWFRKSIEHNAGSDADELNYEQLAQTLIAQCNFAAAEQTYLALKQAYAVGFLG